DRGEGANRPRPRLPPAGNSRCPAGLLHRRVATLVPVVVKYEHLTDPRGEVEALRALLAALAEDAAAVERAPIPTAEALQRLDALARDVAARVEAGAASGPVPSSRWAASVASAGSTGSSRDLRSTPANWPR